MHGERESERKETEQKEIEEARAASRRPRSSLSLSLAVSARSPAAPARAFCPCSPCLLTHERVYGCFLHFVTFELPIGNREASASDAHFSNVLSRLKLQMFFAFDLISLTARRLSSRSHKKQALIHHQRLRDDVVFVSAVKRERERERDRKRCRLPATA
mgnify:CR=1 FL=1